MADDLKVVDSQPLPLSVVSSQPADSHGALYNAANTALNYEPPATPKTGIAPIDATTSFLDSFGNAPADILRGVIKGGLSTAAGIGSILNRFTGSNQPFNQQNLKGLTTANGLAQDIGKGSEQIGEFAAVPEYEGANLLGKLGSSAAKGAAVSAVQSGGDPLATTSGAVLPLAFSSPVVSAAGKILSEGLGLSSGAGAKAIQRAFANPQSSDLLAAMRGDIGAGDVVDNVQNAVTKFRDDASAKYAQELDGKVANASIPNWQSKADDFLTTVRDKVEQRLKDFGVLKQVDPSTGDVTLNMRHVPNENGLKEGMQQIYDQVSDWGSEARDMLPSGLDTLKKNLSPYIDGGGRLGAFAKSVYDTAKSKLNDIIPGYEEMTKDYADASNALREVKSALSVKPDGSTNTQAAVSKIQYMLKQPTDYREMIMNKLPNGQQLLDQVAGLHLHDVAPRGLIGRLLAGGEGVAAMLHPASIPATAAGLALSSPRLVGQGARMAGIASQNVSPLMKKLAINAASSGIANARSGESN